MDGLDNALSAFLPEGIATFVPAKPFPKLGPGDTWHIIDGALCRVPNENDGSYERAFADGSDFRRSNTLFYIRHVHMTFLCKNMSN